MKTKTNFDTNICITYDHGGEKVKRQLGVLILLFFVAVAFSGVAAAACCDKDKCSDDKDKCKCDEDKDKCKCSDNKDKCCDNNDDHDHGHWWHLPW